MLLGHTKAATMSRPADCCSRRDPAADACRAALLQRLERSHQHDPGCDYEPDTGSRADFCLVAIGIARPALAERRKTRPALALGALGGHNHEHGEGARARCGGDTGIQLYVQMHHDALRDPDSRFA